MAELENSFSEIIYYIFYYDLAKNLLYYFVQKHLQH